MQKSGTNTSEYLPRHQTVVDTAIWGIPLGNSASQARSRERFKQVGRSIVFADLDFCICVTVTRCFDVLLYTLFDVRETHSEWNGEWIFFLRCMRIGGEVKVMS